MELTAAAVDTLAFDIFGTVLDLAGSLAQPLQKVLASRSSPVAVPEFWAEWRARQRVEQYQDTLLMRGHSGYLETCRRALVYTAQRLSVELAEDDMESLVAVWRELRPFEDSVRGIERLRGAYRTVALSNGEPWLRPPRHALGRPVRRSHIGGARRRLQAPSGGLPRRRQ